MKNLSLLLCLLFYHVTVDGRSIQSIANRMHIPQENLTECIERSGMTMDELENIFHSPTEIRKLLNDEGDYKQYGCFWACLLQANGMMTGSTFNADAIAASIERESRNHKEHPRAHANVETCVQTVESTDDECEAALNFNKCLIRSKSDRWWNNHV
ncbi:odorant binding protein 12 [Ptiloglossa arizonensis]|uniref:odorant binding protein 12 n=1 Tax=Ptiloglossa arizonensis TaxID=3350558 RepID=UPI003FA060BA